MGYQRKPNYHFRTESEKGIHIVPLGRIIVVENFQGRIRVFIKISDWKIRTETRILDAVLSGCLGEIEIKIGSEILLKSGENLDGLELADGNTIKIKGENLWQVQ